MDIIFNGLGHLDMLLDNTLNLIVCFFMKNSNIGFSLVELLVVVAIIGVLSFTGIVGYQSYSDATKQRVLLANYKTIVKTIEFELLVANHNLGSAMKEVDESGNISELSNKILKQLSENINNWLINPIGSEGYRTAEVTLGGVNTKELSSKTMMSNKHKNLFFIGEVVDVTGHLGGYNFQWAWSSGYVAGQYA